MVAWVVLLSAIVSAVSVPARAAETLVGLGPTTLVSFPADVPGSVLGGPVTITGLTAGDVLVGIDFRPSTGQLYGLGLNTGADTARLYTLDPVTGAATLVSPPGGIGVAVTGDSYGMDFSPVSDRLRIVNDADQNMRIDPATGLVVGTGDPSVAYGVADVNAGQNPFLSNLAYDNSMPGAPYTTLFGIDVGVFPARFVHQGSIGGSQSPNGGQLTTIATISLSGITGFDVSADGVAYLLNSTFTFFDFATRLHRIDTETGAVTLLGSVDGTGGAAMGGLAVAPSSHLEIGAAVTTGSENAVQGSFTVTRSGPDAGVATVDYATFDGTATAGSDYTSQSGRITFAAGETTKTVDLTIADDAEEEQPEALAVVLTNPRGNAAAGALLGARSVAVMSITDDDAPPPVDPAPILFDAAVSRARYRAGDGPKRGTTFSWMLSEAAGVDIVLARRKTGAVAGTLHAGGTTGANSLAFDGRIDGVPLRRGHYTATLTATDAGGQQSGPRTIELRVVR